MRPAWLCRISFIVVLFIAVSCSKENDPAPQKSIENELLSVKITKAGNPQLSKDAFVFKFKEEFYIHRGDSCCRRGYRLHRTDAETAFLY